MSQRVCEKCAVFKEEKAMAPHHEKSRLGRKGYEHEWIFANEDGSGSVSVWIVFTTCRYRCPYELERMMEEAEC